MFGTSVGGYSIYRYQKDKEKCLEYGLSSPKLLALKLIPWNVMSRAAGFLASLQVPIGLRTPVYGSYAWMFDCDLEEMQAPNLKIFPTFNDFFGRELKSGTRPVADAAVVSPCDGRVLVTGKVESVTTDLTIEQVKGVSYSLKHLVGEKELERLVEHLKGGRSLYYCSMYLSPGTYHRYHCPVNKWRVEAVERVHGELFSVSPWFLKLVKEVSFLNERVIASGSWKHGWLTMIPVGATNVGSVLTVAKLAPGAHMKQVEEVGRFNLGSMVILVFTAPKEFEWKITPGQSVKLGTAILSSSSSPAGGWSRWFRFSNK